MHISWGGRKKSNERGNRCVNTLFTAAETTANQQNNPSIKLATTPRTETRTRQHSTPDQGGGHTQARHAPTGGGARTNTAPTPATQTPQATDTRQRRPYGGGDDSEPTKQAEHPAGHNTTNRNRTRRHSAPHQESATPKHGTPQLGGGGHAPVQHQPRRSQQHNRNHNPPNGRRKHKPNTTTAAGGHQHSTPKQEGGHVPTQHAPP